MNEIEQYKVMAKVKAEEFRQTMLRDEVNIDEDFNNALDVLKCFLKEKNYNLLAELSRVFDNRKDLLIDGYEKGYLDGLNNTQ